MIEPKFTVKKEVNKKDYGKFIIEPLVQGYGSTLGTSLRRVLLTSLRGAAVTRIKIEGVKHQFSTLPGLKEDIIELVLNVKKIRVNLTGDQPTVAKLSVKGPAKVTAGDIEVADAEIINKDLYLGELTSPKAKLSMALTIEPGYGYVTSDEVEDSKEFGVIVVDSLFSPIIRVNYKVEATRVGRMTNLDRLVMEIWSDGTISPLEALEDASKTIVSYFTKVFEHKEEAVPASTSVVGTVSSEVMKLTLEELDLPTRIVNALHNGGIDNVGQLVSTPRKALMKIKNLGGKSIDSIEGMLKERGVFIKE